MPSSRPKRPVDDSDGLVPRHTVNGGGNSRKRKGKDKLADVVVEEGGEDAAMDLGEPEGENEQEEEQGVTRCICGKTGMIFYVSAVRHG